MSENIDYDALLSEWDGVTNARQLMDDMAAAIRALRAAALESERDAARYRWLRDGENGGDLSIGDMTEIGDKGWERVTWLYEEELDTAIDAAMAAQEKAQQQKEGE